MSNKEQVEPKPSPEVVALKKEAIELLNQLAIVLKDVKAYKSDYNEDGYGQSNIWSEWNEEEDNEGKVTNDEGFLMALKSYVTLALKGDGETLQEVENKYYSSACW